MILNKKKLRDEFAKEAMSVLIDNVNLRESGVFKNVAVASYRFADAMLEVRENGYVKPPLATPVRANKPERPKAPPKKP